jgi:hypothetical protein
LNRVPSIIDCATTGEISLSEFGSEPVANAFALSAFKRFQCRQKKRTAVCHEVGAKQQAGPDLHAIIREQLRHRV